MNKYLKILKLNGYEIKSRILAPAYFSLFVYKPEKGTPVRTDISVRFPDYSDPSVEVLLDRVFSDINKIVNMTKEGELFEIRNLKWDSVAFDSWYKNMGFPIYANGVTAFDVYVGIVNQSMKLFSFFGWDVFGQLTEKGTNNDGRTVW